MSYSSLLTSTFGKRPIWLYEFLRDGSTTRLCSARSDYTDDDSILWTSAAITHTRFRTTSAIGRAETQIVFPQSDTLARSYLSDLSYSDNSVTIYHEFKDQSPSARVTKFQGRVIGTRPMFTRITLIAENRFTESRRKALAAVMQKPCRHALYHAGCGLSIGDFETAGSMTDLAGNVATVTEASGFTGGHFSGGVFTWNGKRQLITKHVGDELTLLGPVLGLSEAGTPQSVTLAPGCNLTRDTCLNRFDNLDNFGGFPWMDESPFDGKTLF